MIVLAITLISINLGPYNFREDIKIMTETSFSNLESTYNKIIERDTLLLGSTLDVLIQDKIIKENYIKKNREELYDYNKNLFIDLEEGGGITNWNFILPNGTLFLRMHLKEVFGDFITRAVFNKSRDTNGLSSGLDLGKAGYALRVIKPYYKDDELIGYMELGENIDHFLVILQKTVKNGNFAMMVDKAKIDKEEWAFYRKNAGLRNNWDDIEGSILISSTIDDGAQCFNSETLKEIEGGKKFVKFLKNNGRYFACGGFEIIDASGEHSGAILSLSDVTDDLMAMTAVKTKALIIMAISFFIIAIVCGFILYNSISKPIKKLEDDIENITKGDLSIKLEKSNIHEIQSLTDSLDRILASLKLAVKKTGIIKEELGLVEEKKPEEKFAQAFKFVAGEKRIEKRGRGKLKNSKI